MVAMQMYHTTNYLISEQAGENLYLNNFECCRNDYIPNTVFVDMYDKECTQKVVSAENKHFNAYYSYINTKSLATKAVAKRTVQNDYSTTKKILFYAVLSGIPSECDIGGQVYPADVPEDELDAIVESVRELCEKYTTAEIVVSSTILKYVNQNGKDNDLLKQKIATLNNQKISYVYEFDPIEENTYFLVVTNKESLLFVHCNAQNVPCAVVSCCDAERVCDRYLTCSYHPSVKASSFEVFEPPSEFYVVPREASVYPEMDQYFSRYLANVSYMNKELLALPLHPRPTKLHLFNDAMMLQSVLGSQSNAEVMELTPEIAAEGALLVTLNKFDKFHTYCRNNRDTPLNWLCFDFDCVHSQCEESFLRFYLHNYTSYKQIYEFDSLEALCAKFNFPSITPIKFEGEVERGTIVVCLDNPFGPNYANMQAWIDEWKSCFEKLVYRFPANSILVRPYVHEPVESAELCAKHLPNYPNVTLDASILDVDFSDYLRGRDDVLFCLKRQGAEFVKCFITGTIMISGLRELELQKKPDAKMIGKYEYTLDHLMDGDLQTKLEEIRTFYKTNLFENMKTMTSHFVAIDDLENGYFLNKIFSP